jgi:endonuclease/exonuclease/phosphatase family metal-dependent hydrolase
LADAETIGEFLGGVEDALDQVAANDFTERAEAIAALIVEKDPYLLGLQEVYKFTSYAGLNGSPPFLDYLVEIKEALSEQGACYEDVATVTNLDTNSDLGPIPVPNYGPVGITDRDVILARCGLEYEVVDLTGFPLCRPSDDGCNYTNVALAATPVGDIAFERGYVAVDTIYGRFFNTHLEVRDPDPDNPLSRLVQRAQAMELINAISVAASNDPPPGPVIVVGDINSSPEDPDDIPDFQPPYMQFESAGYVDAWTLRPGKPKGFTCCFDEDLSIPADLYERIDVIFSYETPSRVKANVLGNDEADQTASGLWPSDHAGVAARIKF